MTESDDSSNLRESQQREGTAEPSLPRQPSESLAAEVERRMLHEFCGHPPIVTTMCSACAVAVAVELIERERKVAFGEHALATEWQGRAEAAEKKYQEAKRHVHRWWGTGDTCQCCGEQYPEHLRAEAESNKEVK